MDKQTSSDTAHSGTIPPLLCVQKWPSIVFKVYHNSQVIGRDEFVAYGLCSLPTTPGLHSISCPTWHAADSRKAIAQLMYGECPMAAQLAVLLASVRATGCV